MPMSEPPAWTQARMERLKQQYPELQYADPNRLMQVDNYSVNNSNPPSQFSSSVMRLATFASKENK
jgi:hypothetical protein